MLAVRASRRPKKLSTKRRASSVESSRSVEAWNEPTFSAREWRSAALEVLGANGSCTCTKSSCDAAQQFLDVRATSIGSARGRRRGRRARRRRAPRRPRSRAACRRRCPRAGSAGRPAPRAAPGARPAPAPASATARGSARGARAARARRQTRDVGVDLVVLRLPRIRGDMGDREPAEAIGPAIIAPPPRFGARLLRAAPVDRVAPAWRPPLRAPAVRLRAAPARRVARSCRARRRTWR